ncbi:hypothetical protein [Actinomadura madurae]|uniref:hypothetical protein n=1 Tax=Actinomadura madurae TaxID=1993 RepID=UPI0020270118|nr:hypothetical protein [Actinomadura madurae]MCP9953138.1 hypothetical protein [Actinomadura madurae]MCP9969903.1 hypothetical protein [Actinomadura madurae]MCP9982351.1 hypothetical protein [Actinomadura madurae]MCQ0006118.1 hypothetical protein [Actinomadura madurae]MCQ0018599.1 hypothetical protein [Actinomadura madurae]
MVALAVGSATILGTVMATVGGFVAEWRRTRLARRYEQDQRLEKDQEEHRQELHAALGEVRLAVIRVSIDTQLAQKMRQSPAARLDDQDLPAQIRRTRDDYPIAEAALLRLWAASRSEETRTAVTSLLEDVAWAFDYGSSADGSDIDPAEVDRRIRRRIQDLSVAVMVEGTAARQSD